MSEAAQQINVYVCQRCGWRAITKNLAAGVTPMFIRCEGRQCDRGELPGAVSSLYRVRQDLTPTHEWYRPAEDELARKPWMRAHVEAGGLALRKVGELEMATR